ncbi:MAG: hypothetical protein ACLPID_00090 [Beijerinckiaceae bacterium]
MSYANSGKAAGIVRDAGGRIVGRTRLQKIAYLLSVAGLEDGLPFAYRHYGPYSEELASAARAADLVGLLRETEQLASWGGTYSTYVVTEQPSSAVPPARRRLAAEAAAADAIELELAATAVFLAKEGYQDPWAETARRKPEKAENGRLDKARELYRKLSAIETPIPLPAIE